MKVSRALLCAALAAAPAAALACGRDDATPTSHAASATTSREGAPPASSGSNAAPGATGATDSTQSSAATAPLSLAPGQVAVIEGGLALTDSDLDRYLGTVYARLPEGDDALQQLLTEAVIDAAAAQAGVTATDDEIAALETRLEAQAREGSGGKLGLKESLGQSVTLQDLHAALRLQVLHEGIVRHELGLPADAPVDPAQLKAWIDAHLPGDALEALPLDDPLAVRWPGGELSKAAVGRRLRSMLPARDVSGVLTEMIGVLLVRREAERLGLALTPAAATEEVLDRNAALKAKAGIGDVSYDQFVETVQKRSLKELIASDQFGAEVLLRLISERNWTEDSARAQWQAHPEKFPAPAAAPVVSGVATAAPAEPVPQDWEHMRASVWRALRQDAYTRLFQQSRIVRRF